MFENVAKDFFLSPWQLNEAGNRLIYKPTSDIKDKYDLVFQSVFPNISVQPSTPQGQIITALTEQDTNDLNLISELANSFFLGGEGQWLDDWAYTQFRLKRKIGIPSSVIVDVEGSAGAVITSGFTVSDGTLNYVYSGEYVIPQNGEGQITCICTEITQKESVVGSVVNIVTPLQGIFRVSNPNNSTPSTLEESDSDFYNRCISYGTTFRNTSIYAVIAEVMNVSGVSKVNGYDNIKTSPFTFQGTQFDAHSFGIVALGGSDEDVAKAIQASKPPCTGMMGTSSVSLPNQSPLYADRLDYNRDYPFYRPTNVPLKFNVTVRLNSKSPQNFKQVVQEAITWYVNQIPIGGSVDLSEVSCAILGYANGGFGIKSCQFNKKSASSYGTTSIELQFVELATIALEDIVVGT